jgi:hypothetical protein
VREFYKGAAEITRWNIVCSIILAVLDEEVLKGRHTGWALQIEIWLPAGMERWRRLILPAWQKKSWERSDNILSHSVIFHNLQLSESMQAQ